MAKFRLLQTRFWQDEFVVNLTPEEKYFYLYLLTNAHASACGIYELPRRVMELETGYNRETTDKLVERFIGYKKIAYHPPTSEVFIRNWIRHNPPKSPTMMACIVRELNEVKFTTYSAEYVEQARQTGYRIHGVSIPHTGGLISREMRVESREREEREKPIVELALDAGSPQDEKTEKPNGQIRQQAAEVLAFLNDKTGRKFRATDTTLKPIICRLKSGASLQDCKTVIARQWLLWSRDEKMFEYMRPSTLFRASNFEDYLGSCTTEERRAT